MAAPTITIYTTGTCAYCKAEKQFLQEHDFKYTEVRVDTDEAAAAKMIELSGQMSVPFTVISGAGGTDGGTDDAQIVGFDRARLATALGIA